MLMESEPDTDNVVYMDEYPELKKRVWLRRLAVERLSKKVLTTTIIYLPDPPESTA